MSIRGVQRFVAVVQPFRHELSNTTARREDKLNNYYCRSLGDGGVSKLRARARPVRDLRLASPYSRLFAPICNRHESLRAPTEVRIEPVQQAKPSKRGKKTTPQSKPVPKPKQKPKKGINAVIAFKKEDRQFTSFWKDKMQVQAGDNRRHIPLVAVMKGMLSASHGDAVEQGQLAEFEQTLDDFFQSMALAVPEGDISTKARKALNVLTNLRSHIFFGHGHMNQIMGSLADSLDQNESKTMVKIDRAVTLKDLQEVLAKWLKDFRKQVQQSPQYCAILQAKSSRSLTREELMSQMMCQLTDVVSYLTPENYPDLEEFKAEARALIRDLRDSYATDISDAGNDQVRVWQNAHWLPCHQTMIQLAQAPSLEGLKQVLRQVVDLEQDFARLVSDLLQQQGFKVAPSHFMMGSQTYLNSDEQKPVRKALEALLQQPL